MVRRIQIVGLLVLGFLHAATAAGELNEGMQSFFDGKIQQSHRSLTQQIEAGLLDARLFYFRGLANSRLGNAQAAAADFQRAADLELSGAGYGVGEALQRVQGRERLMLEKYRTMARLSRRHRHQPVAPKPVVRQLNDRPVTAFAEVVASSPAVPRFRLASEIPVRQQLSDSISGQRSLVSNEQPPGEPELVLSANDDVPVGTGVVQASATSEIADDSNDPFAADEGTEVDGDDPFAELESGTESSSSTSGLFGAFRAIGRSIIPQVDPSKLVPQGVVSQGMPVQVPGNGPPQQ